MRFVGNFLWFIFCGGLINCILWLLAGLVFAITIIGLPFSRSAFEIAKMSAFPFGKEAVHVRDLNGEDGDNLIAGADNTSFTSVNLLGKKIVADNRGFFQSNTEVFRMLLENELNDLEGELAIDLFSGVGPFAAILEDNFEKVIAVEADERCLRVAKKHLKKTKFFTERAEEWAVSHPDLEPDLLVVDPPREGLDSKLIKMIASWKPRKVLYVSCDPVTQARDLRIFNEETDYKLLSVRGYDFYPQTHHMESVAWLELKD